MDSKVKPKYFNPLRQEKVTPVSESSISSTSASGYLDVETENVCPKCQHETVPVMMADGFPAKYCDSCRVTLPIKISEPQ